MSPGRKLRDLIANRRYVTTPGITAPLHAMIVQQAGFEFAYMGGYDTSLTLLGLPDVGLITETEMVTNARNIARAVDIPLVCDADTGYGNAINVMRTVRDFESAGVAAIHIEDQVSPKRCGHVAGKMVIPMDEAVGKIRAALDARSDPGFMVIARTDAVAAKGGGLDEGIRRALAFADAGCDMIWCEFPSSDPEMPRRFAAAVHRERPGMPLWFNYSSNLRWYESGVRFEELADMGYKVIHVSLVAMRVAMRALWDYAVALRETGAQAEIDFQRAGLGHPMGSFHRFAGFDRIKAMEEKYLPAEDVEAKYDGAVGL